MTDPLRLMVRPWFERMKGCSDDVLELRADGCPSPAVDDAPFGRQRLQGPCGGRLLRGATLPDPPGLLEGSGKHMRHVKLRPGVAVDEPALTALIATAYADIRRRLSAG